MNDDVKPMQMPPQEMHYYGQQTLTKIAQGRPSVPSLAAASAVDSFGQRFCRDDKRQP